MNKNILFIITGIVVVLLIGGGVYWFFFMMGEEEGLVVVDNPQDGTFLLGGGGNEFPELEADQSEDPGRAPTQEFARISSNSVAGFTLHTTGTGTSTATLVRYALRSTGHVYDYNLDTGERTRVSSASVPHTFNAEWGNEGVFLQHFSPDGERINTSFVDLSDTTSTSTVRNTLKLSTDITNISVNGNRFAWVRTVGNESVIEVGNVGSINPVTIFESGFRDWDIAWSNPNTLLLTTKPSAHVEGHTYTLSTKGGLLNPVLRGIEGLTMKTNELYNLYSRGTNTSFDLFAKNTSTGSVIQLDKTLPEKCAFFPQDDLSLLCAVPSSIPNAAYPDAWYQGRIQFKDMIQQINLGTGIAETVHKPLNTEIDLVNPLITPDERYFIAIDKTTGELWRLQL